MNELILTEAQQNLIEKFGVELEKTGLTPAQSRVGGLLIVCDRTELTFDEIKDLLKLSKSATSNAISSLLMMDRIKYQTKLGDRKRYFSSKIGGMEEDFKLKFAHMLKFRNILFEILESRTNNTPDFNEKLKGVIDFLDFIHSKLPGLYEDWQAHKK